MYKNATYVVLNDEYDMNSTVDVWINGHNTYSSYISEDGQRFEFTPEMEVVQITYNE